MMDAEQIVELILDAARESRVLTGGIYKDEPIIRTGRQAFGGSARNGAREPRPEARQLTLDEIVSRSVKAEAVPKRIMQMRALDTRRNRWISSYEDPKVFYEQACFMQDYTDNRPYGGNFERYYPTYADMTDAQLRGYFTWRTRWRAGEEPKAPTSFVFVHVYELLCGVGAASPAQGMEELSRIYNAYALQQEGGALRAYLPKWMRDYAIYHGLEMPQLAGLPPNRCASAIAVIDAAEQALLASGKPGVWDGSLPGMPDAGELTRALASASTYRLERSKVFSACFEELAECCAYAFARMVDHCARRRKLGFCDGLFGAGATRPYTMFSSAVFYDPAPHPDCTVAVEDGVEYSCVCNRWSVTVAHGRPKPSAKLGDILHEIDRVLRLELGGLPELKERAVPKYVHDIVGEEVRGVFARQAALQAARVTINRSALTGIRAAAVRTREALLVDEEREEAAEPVVAVAVEPAADAAAAQPVAGLSAEDAAYLRALLAGAPAQAPGGMASLAVDRINEALFELVGDTVIEFEGDAPRVVEDYADEVREVLG